MYAQWENSPEKALLSSNAIDAGFKVLFTTTHELGQRLKKCNQIRPTEEELKEMGPEFNELYDRYFKDKPDKPVM